MNSFGLLAGLTTLLIIGLGFPLVIYSERFFGYVCWPYLMGLGTLVVAASLLVPADWAAVVVGVLGATCIWGSTELEAQSQRARLGWFASRKDKIKVPFADIIGRWKAPHL